MIRPRNDRLARNASTSIETSPDEFVTRLQACDKRMRALAYTMLGSSSAMDDVLQEAYLKAFRAYGGFRGESSFATWLGAIVYRCCLDHGRAAARHRWSSIDAIGDDRLTDGRIPDNAVDAHLHVMAALGRLGADHRAVLVLVDLEGFSTREAAEMIGVPAGTIASRLSRARDALREVLRTDDDTSTADPRSSANRSIDQSGKDAR